MIHYNVRKGMKNIKAKTNRAITLLAAGTIGLVMALGVSFGASAATNSTAAGSLDFSAYGLQRHVGFSVQPTSTTCTYGWNVNGSYTFDLEYLGGHYIHDATISGQSASGAYNISGGYPAGGPFAYAWNGTGNVSGNNVTNSVDYTVGAPGTHMNMAGTIAPSGTFSGTWSDNYGGTRSGTWTTASGSATKVFNGGCSGSGVFSYTDVNGNKYYVSVKYVKISGNQVWLAGPVTYGNIGAGQWLFAKVRDAGTPGITGDQVWGSFTTESAAKTGVATMSDPADGPFAITSGALYIN